MLNSDIPNLVHPGDILADMIKEENLTIDLFADRIKMDPLTLKYVCNKKIDVSIDFAVKFAMYFGTSIDLWLNLQKNYNTIKYRIKGAGE